jgi:hypothetical protein
MKSKKYHTVGTVPKNTTLSEQFQKIPHCRNSSKKYHTVGTVPKSNSKIVERGKINNLSTQIHDLSLFWPWMGTSVKSGGVKLVVSA